MLVPTVFPQKVTDLFLCLLGCFLSSTTAFASAIVISGTTDPVLPTEISQDVRKKIGAAGVSTGLSTVAAGLAAFPEPVITKGAAAVTAVGQGIGLIGLGLWDFFASAPMNPDPNHGVLASVTPVIFAPVNGIDEPVLSAVNSTLAIGGRVIDDSRLVDISLRRYFGGIADGDNIHAELQRVAASRFLFQLVADKLSFQNSLDTLSSSLQGTPFTSISTNIDQVLTFQAQVLASGFPPFEQSVFAQMAATPHEINLALQELASFTRDSLLAAGVTDADFAGGVIFNSHARELNKVDIFELLPENFQVVPEPSALTMFRVGIFCMIGYGWIRRRRRLSS